LIVGRAATILYGRRVRKRRLRGEKKRDRRKKTYGGIGDFAFLDRNIKVDANEDAFSLEIKVSNRKFV